MSKFALIGSPISHSKSPALFAAAYPDFRHTYSLLEEDDAQKAVEKFFRSDFKGVNVTSPFKDRVMKYVTCPDRISSLLGSANVLVKGSGFAPELPEVYSYNTDYYGVKNTVGEFLQKKELLPGNILKHGVGNVLVVGAGGAGKAAALALCDMGFDVTIANRSAGKTADFAAEIGAAYIPLNEVEIAVGRADVIVYSLSFLVDGLDKCDFSQKIVFEANYAKPSFSPESGVKCGLYIDGRNWLYHQAVPAFELFTGEAPNILAMRNIIGV